MTGVRALRRMAAVILATRRLSGAAPAQCLRLGAGAS